MTQCIDPSDPRYFTETSDGIYDRHHYRIVNSDGQSVVVDNWEEVRSIWWNNKFLSHVDVLDIRKKAGKGF